MNNSFVFVAILVKAKMIYRMRRMQWVQYFHARYHVKEITNTTTKSILIDSISKLGNAIYGVALEGIKEGVSPNGDKHMD